MFIPRRTYYPLEPCGDRSRNTSQRYLIILELMHFTSFFNFNTKGDDFRNKEQVKSWYLKWCEWIC